MVESCYQSMAGCWTWTVCRILTVCIKGNRGKIVFWKKIWSLKNVVRSQIFLDLVDLQATFRHIFVPSLSLRTVPPLRCIHFYRIQTFIFVSFRLLVCVFCRLCRNSRQCFCDYCCLLCVAHVRMLPKNVFMDSIKNGI